jgi:hypothetical protein
MLKTSIGGAIYRGGRPAWADRPGWPRASPGLSFLQRDDLPFVTFVPACSTTLRENLPLVTGIDRLW